MPASHSTRRGAFTRRGRTTAVSGAGLLATVLLAGSLVGCSEEGEQIPC